MRLETEAVRAIKNPAIAAFGPNVIIGLFGSRVRGDLRGGVHVEVDDGGPDIARAEDGPATLNAAMTHGAAVLDDHARVIDYISTRRLVEPR